jgi:hypothetical protein
MDTKYTHESIPTQVRAMQISDNVGTTYDRILEIAGVVQASDSALLVTWRDGRAGQVQVEGLTIQGQPFVAYAGEWLVQEHDDRHRFYPVAADVFARRYRSL